MSIILISCEFLSHFTFKFLVLSEQMVSRHRMRARAGISVMALHTTSYVSLLELPD
jgi:hypothetical protein